MTGSHKVSEIAVIGSGYMGGGMAQVFTMAGYNCVVADATAELAHASVERLLSEARSFEKQGLFPAGSRDQIAARLSAAESIEDAVAKADYIAEVVSERMDVKDSVLARISGAAPSSAIIASNTSAIPIEILAASVELPDRFVGVHWMNPAPFVPTVEIIPSSHTSPEVMDKTEELIKGLGKVTSRVSDVAGFVANRLQFALFQEAVRMVEEGASTPELIDEVVSNSFGFRLPFFGPFAGADMAGLDVYVGAYESLSKAYGERYAAPKLLSDRVAQGDLGIKTGGGFRGMDPSRINEIVSYRNRAYTALAKLKEELGPFPG